MAVKPVAFRQEYTGNATSDRAQRQAQLSAHLANELAASLPFQDGVFVTGAVIGTSDTVVTHGLGRTPVGYIVTRVRGNAVAWRESTSLPSRTDKQWSFIASGSPITLDLYFF